MALDQWKTIIDLLLLNAKKAGYKTSISLWRTGDLFKEFYGCEKQ
jgi:hypothetical protein